MGRLERRHRSTLGAALIIASGALLWAGCNVERDYEMLSFLFDGVPEPAPAAMEEGDGRRPRFDGSSRMAIGNAVSAHSAYVERRCAECHGDRARFGFRTEGFADLTAAVCARCHEPALQARHLHGPVALGECLLCHEPHVSAHPQLLLDASPALCLACHEDELEADPPAPPHEDLARDCLECHHGHGGDDPYFLRRPETPG